MMYVVDANILLRIIQTTHPMHPQASLAVDRLLSQGENLCILPQAIYECWVVCTRPLAQNGLELTVSVTHAELTKMQGVFALLPDTPAIFPVWGQLVLQYSVKGKPAHDARIVAAMKAHGVTHLLTFNTSDFARYQGITAITPDAIVSQPPSPSNP
jgi:predicted nucleic acid-binding protein